MSTKERNETIVRRFDAGETLQAIGDDVGITRERVRQIVKRAGCVPKRTRQQERDALVAQVARAERLTTGEIAERFGLSYGVASGIADRCGLPRPRRTKANEDEMEGYAALFAQGTSARSIASGDRALEMRIIYYCRAKGIRNGWEKVRVQPEQCEGRAEVILAGRKAGMSWPQVRQCVGEAENRSITLAGVYNWARKNIANLPEVDGRRKPKPAKAPRLVTVPRVERKVAVRSEPPAIIIKDTIRETALANRGRASAKQIAAAVGVTRNSIIGHWFRARKEAA